MCVDFFQRALKCCSCNAEEEKEDTGRRGRSSKLIFSIPKIALARATGAWASKGKGKARREAANEMHQRAHKTIGSCNVKKAGMAHVVALGLGAVL
jgi:hypothetical protein